MTIDLIFGWVCGVVFTGCALSSWRYYNLKEMERYYKNCITQAEPKPLELELVGMIMDFAKKDTQRFVNAAMFLSRNTLWSNKDVSKFIQNVYERGDFG